MQKNSNHINLGLTVYPYELAMGKSLFSKFHPNLVATSDHYVTFAGVIHKVLDSGKWSDFMMDQQLRADLLDTKLTSLGIHNIDARKIAFFQGSIMNRAREENESKFRKFEQPYREFLAYFHNRNSQHDIGLLHVAGFSLAAVMMAHREKDEVANLVAKDVNQFDEGFAITMLRLRGIDGQFIRSCVDLFNSSGPNEGEGYLGSRYTRKIDNIPPKKPTKEF